MGNLTVGVRIGRSPSEDCQNRCGRSLERVTGAPTGERQEKSAGADSGPDGAVAGGGAGGAGVEAAAGDGAGGLPRASEQGGEEVARQDMAGQTPRRQIPAAVELPSFRTSRDEFLRISGTTQSVSWPCLTSFPPKSVVACRADHSLASKGRRSVPFTRQAVEH